VHWLDEIARNWDPFLPYTLLDNDVIAIGTSSLGRASYHGVGTTLFNIAAPVGKFVRTNQRRHDVRSEPNARGKFVQNRASRSSIRSGIATPHHLVSTSTTGHRRQRRARAVDLHSLDVASRRGRVAAAVRAGRGARRGWQRDAAHFGRRRPGG
jgi:hypothetical protein